MALRVPKAELPTALGVVLIADGGGLAAAVLVPIHGAEPVATLLARADQAPAEVETTIVWLNGAPAGRIDSPASSAPRLASV